MSRFVDVDAFLRDREVAQQTEQDEFQKRVFESRQTHDPLLRSMLETFKDFKETVLDPRIDLLAVTKKKEQVPSDPNKRTNIDPYFLYRVNLIHPPGSALPYPIADSSYELFFAQPGKTTSLDWTPNVACQFDVSLHDTYDHVAKQYTGNLRPEVVIKAWGIIPHEPNSIVQKDLLVSSDNSYNRWHTSVWIDGEKPAAELEGLLVQALTIVAPLVIDHRKNVQS